MAFPPLNIPAGMRPLQGRDRQTGSYLRAASSLPSVDRDKLFFQSFLCRIDRNSAILQTFPMDTHSAFIRTSDIKHLRTGISIV